jgi:hypothetical protein
MPHLVTSLIQDAALLIGNAATNRYLVISFSGVLMVANIVYGLWY